MEQISVHDARKRFSQLLDQVQSGEDVLVLRRGQPAARMVRPNAERIAFESRASLRASLPPLDESAGKVIRDLRDAERY